MYLNISNKMYLHVYMWQILKSSQNQIFKYIFYIYFEIYLHSLYCIKYIFFFYLNLRYLNIYKSIHYRNTLF